VINAAKAVFTGRKETDKKYMTYSQYPGKEKVFSPKALRARHPEEIIRRAVRGMIPHNRLGRQVITKLKVYGGPEHPHTAQQPVATQV
jgi:large subunit ribosomal protein L13